MTRVLVLVAVDLEARGLARHLGLTRLGDPPWPHFAGGALEVVSVGLRAAHLAARVRADAQPGLVVSAGACGGLDPALGAGALVVPEAVATADGQRWTTGPLPGLSRRGTLLSVPDVVESAAAKTRLWLETGALAVDMESAPILAWAAARGVPGAVVRAVADTAERGVPADLARAVGEDGRLKPMSAVGAVLARPGAVAEAMALRHGTAAALKSVAHALAALARQP